MMLSELSIISFPGKCLHFVDTSTLLKERVSHNMEQSQELDPQLIELIDLTKQLVDQRDQLLAIAEAFKVASERLETENKQLRLQLKKLGKKKA